MIGYKILKTILSPIYKFWYRPTVIGKENIPVDGAVILAGNHIHIMDQCNVIISTKRNIHYMAKKEYFDNKLVAWFFKTAGCIPVDRSKKDVDAKSAAIDVLNNKHALGIFPEGTRNSLKEEKIKELYNKYFKDTNYKSFEKKVKKNKTSFVLYLEELMNDKVITKNDFLDNIFNVDEFLKRLIKDKKISKEDYYNHILLPLKYGAVSLASKTNAYIIPYAISGNYKFRSKNLTIMIGKPFKVTGSLEDAYKVLDKEIKTLLKELDKKVTKNVK